MFFPKLPIRSDLVAKYFKEESEKKSKDKNIDGDGKSAIPGRTAWAEVEKDKSNNKQQSSSNLSDVKARSNFNETAFFFPQLQTNEKGEVIIKFTVPDFCLTGMETGAI